MPDAPAEEAIANGLKCFQCDRNFQTERGLNSHTRQAHKSIPQVDGASEELEILYTFESEFALEDVMYTVEEVCTKKLKLSYFQDSRPRLETLPVLSMSSPSGSALLSITGNGQR